MTTRRLPVLGASSLGTDGRRNTVYPADVRGRFDRARIVGFVVLIALWIALPWIKIGGRPGVFLDVDAREFYLFGASFNAQDVWLLFFLATGVGFGLVYLTAIAGRAWCGWACPQTVFLEGVYRRIERFVEGPREKRMRLHDAPWSAEKIARATTKHGLYVAASILIAHIILAYFVSLPREIEMIRHRPSAHPEAFAWAFGLSALLYGNFAWFREQLCVVLCPYGRLQSVLLDEHSLVVGYDATRGEPRGKATEKDKGACVDCKRCVVVCPTGIDIRNGLQLDCIACTACIDACDDVMDKLGRPRGLVRYDSQAGLAWQAKKVVRPRLVLYTVLLVIGAIVAAFAVRARTSFEATLLRLPGEPYVIVGDDLRNAFDLHIVNKRGGRETFHVVVDAGAEVTAIVPMSTLTLDAQSSAHAPVFLTLPRDRFDRDFAVRVRVSRDGGETTVVTGKFLGARR
jgi:cytochrome c oxidase accessory protein FixG